ncbi:MAG: DUF4129 domain-containing protein [Anaerolineaceae bacterium]|nr:DUF4129 domain-containing protein [Anaerolineaceae bacterium]
MTDRDRRPAILYLALAIVALLLLAAGLDGLELQPGRPFAGLLTTGEEDGSGPAPAPAVIADTALLVVGLLMALLVPLAIVYLFVQGDRRRRFLYALILLLGLVGLYLASRAEPARELVPPATEVAPEMSLDEGLLAIPGAPPVELEVRPPAWLAWLAAALLALLAAGIVLATAWLVWVRTRPAPGPLPRIAERAQAALADLEAGAGVRDAVMRCYLEMSRVLEQERGLARDEAMTPREFEVALRNTGLPREPVANLTRLFEAVRYGAVRASRREEEQAVACLSAIVAACRSAA